MNIAEKQLVEKLLERDRELAALAAEVARLRMAVAAIDACAYSSDVHAIVKLALKQ